MGLGFHHGGTEYTEKEKAGFYHRVTESTEVFWGGKLRT